MNKFLLHVCLFFCVVIALESCQKDSKSTCNNDNSDCKELTGNMGPLARFYSGKFQRRAPCFNPNNSNEIVYYRKNDSTFTYELVYYNLNTKEEEVLIHNQAILNQPKWGKNNIILFGGLDYRIHGYNMNTKSHSIVLDLPCSIYPEWISDSEFICLYSQKLAIPYYLLKYNITNNKLDTLKDYFFTLPSANNKGQIAYVTYNSDPHLNIFDMNFSSKILTSFAHNGRNSIEGICFDNSSNYVYYTTQYDGLFKININTLKTEKVKNTCSSKTYSIISISNDDKYIIAERIDNSIIEWKGMISYYDLAIMDIDGKNERKVFK